MELWDLYDGDRNPLGKTAVRGELDRKNEEYHIVVDILTMNSRGQILVTQRDYEKQSYPGKWEFTGGSVIAGEDSLTGAKRELFEETGIKVTDDEIRFVMTHKRTLRFADCYFVRKDVDIKDIALQPGETIAAKWVNKKELENIIAMKLMPLHVERLYKEMSDFLMNEGFV